MPLINSGALFVLEYFVLRPIHCDGRRKTGNLIRVDASDNVMVAKVRVTILDAEGKVLEQGRAVQAEANWWEYISSNKGKVVAEAQGLAENGVRKEE